MFNKIRMFKSESATDKTYLTARRITTFPRKLKDEKNMHNAIKGKRHLLRKVTFKIERPNLWRILKNALKIEHSSDSDLTVFQFCMIAFVQNRCTTHIEYVFQLSLQYGIILTMFIYMLTTFLISMPMYIIFLSMASYSKKGAISFWDSVPLMRGFAYSWVLFSLIIITENLRDASNCIYRLVIMKEFQSAIKCDNISSDGYICIPAQNNYTKISITNCTYIYSTQHYVFTHLALYFNTKLNFFCTICTLGLMAFTIWISLRGLNATKKLLQCLFLFGQGLFVIIMAMSFFTTPKYTVSTDIFSLRQDPLFNLKYWSAILPITIQLLSVGNIIWLGRFKPKKIRPDVFSIILHIIRYTYFVITYCWMMHVVQNIMANYGISSTCLYKNKFSILMIGIPDILLRYYPSGIPCAAWFLVLAIMYIISSIYRMICILDGFLELKMLKNKKKYLVLFVFIIASIYTLQFGYSRSKNMSWYWLEFFTRPWLSFQFFAQCVSIIHIYSIKRFVNDYQFTYRTSPGVAWVKMWQGITIYLIVLIVLAANWLLSIIDEISAKNIMPSCYPTILCLILSMPTFILFVLHSCKYLKKHATYQSTLPLSTWGPVTSTKRSARTKFLPERDIKYRHVSVTCRHVCLVKLASYEEEKKIQITRIDKLLCDFEGDLKKYGNVCTSSSDEEVICIIDKHVAK